MFIKQKPSTRVRGKDEGCHSQRSARQSAGTSGWKVRTGTWTLVRASQSGETIPNSTLTLTTTKPKRGDPRRLYESLGIESDASDDDIRMAARRRMQETHPDHGGSAQEFMRVVDAYRTLTHDRAAYDSLDATDITVKRIEFDVPERKDDGRYVFVS